jgi:hypothetical protein
VDITFQSDPHTLGNRFEAVDSGGFGGNYLNKFFRLTLMSQVTDAAVIAALPSWAVAVVFLITSSVIFNFWSITANAFPVITSVAKSTSRACFGVNLPPVCSSNIPIYISEVFKLNTDSIKRIDSTNDYIPTNGGQVGSRFNKSRSIFFKTGKWEEHNNMFGETDTLTNTYEQLLRISMATGGPLNVVLLSIFI